MIPKKDMKDGMYYLGICRNTYIAKWDAKNEGFVHITYAFQYHMDRINHFEDVKEIRLDGFIPVQEIPNLDWKEIRRIKTEVGYW